MARIFHLTNGIQDCPQCGNVGCAYKGEMRDAIGTLPALMCVHGCGKVEQVDLGSGALVSAPVIVLPFLPPPSLPAQLQIAWTPTDPYYDPRPTPPMHFERCKCDIKDLLSEGHKKGCSKI